MILTIPVQSNVTKAECDVGDGDGGSWANDYTFEQMIC
jgi:hypothetical protein